MSLTLVSDVLSKKVPLAVCFNVDFYYKGKLIAAIPDKLFLAPWFDGEDDFLEKETDVFSVPSEGGEYLCRFVNSSFSRIDVEFWGVIPHQRVFSEVVLSSLGLTGEFTPLVSAYYASIRALAAKTRVILQQGLMSGGPAGLWEHVPARLSFELSHYVFDEALVKFSEAFSYGTRFDLGSLAEGDYKRELLGWFGEGSHYYYVGFTKEFLEEYSTLQSLRVLHFVLQVGLPEETFFDKNFQDNENFVGNYLGSCFAMGLKVY